MNENGFLESLPMAILTAVLAENFVFARAFGVSTMIMSAKSKRNLPGICLGVCYFTVTASLVSWAVSRRIGFSAEKPYVPLTYSLMIGALYAVTLVIAFLIFRGKFGKIKKYVHIAAFNSVVMGTIFLSASGCEGLEQFLLFGICAGLGFTAAAVMLSGVYSQLYSEDVPHAFRGYPAVMIFAGIIAMAVYGIMGRVPSFA